MKRTKGYTYILKCADGSYYTGSTKNPIKRVEEHKNGLEANHTASRLPIELIYYEEFERIDDAFYREKQIQKWSRAKKEALIYNETGLLNSLAQCKNGTYYKNKNQ